MNEELLKAITCPITKKIMNDPVIAADGYTYEREAIADLFARCGYKLNSPVTNKPLTNLHLIHNFALAAVIKTYHKMEAENKRMVRESIVFGM